MAEIIFTPAGAGVGANSMYTVANRTALAALGTATFAIEDGAMARVLSDNSLWRYDAASTLAADYTGTAAIPAGAVTSANLVLVPTGAAAGRWIRADKAFTARYAFVQATADNVALCTVPATMALRVLGMPYFDITRYVAGDGARRIGASGSFGAFGGNAGDFIGATNPTGVAAQAGTIGADFAAADAGATPLTLYQTCLILPTQTITYDITVAGTDEADGMICVPVALETGVGTMIS